MSCLTPLHRPTGALDDWRALHFGDETPDLRSVVTRLPAKSHHLDFTTPDQNPLPFTDATPGNLNGGGLIPIRAAIRRCGSTLAAVQEFRGIPVRTQAPDQPLHSTSFALRRTQPRLPDNQQPGKTWCASGTSRTNCPILPPLSATNPDFRALSYHKMTSQSFPLATGRLDSLSRFRDSSEATPQ